MMDAYLERREAVIAAQKAAAKAAGRPWRLSLEQLRRVQLPTEAPARPGRLVEVKE